MAPSLAARLLGLAVLVIFAGCAASAPKRAPVATRFQDRPKFPAKARLEQIATEVELDLPTSLGRMLPRFDLEGPFGDPLQPGPHPAAPGFVDDLIARAQSRKGMMANDALACVARNLGRFWLGESEMPAPPLQQFITARCGAQISTLRFRYLTGTVPARVTDRALQTEWAQDLVKLRSAFNGALEVGAWFGRTDDQVIFVVAAGQREAQAEVIVRNGDKVRIEGQLLTASEDTSVFVNRGAYEVGRCEPDSLVPAPRFAVDCPLLIDDAFTWLDLSVRAPGRQLGRTVLTLLVPVAGQLPDGYVDPLGLAPAVATSTTELQSSLLSVINEVRTRAGFPGLALEPAQTYSAARVSTQYFASAGQDGEMADEIATGLMAGWDVGTQVRSAGFYALMVSGTRDASILATALLSRPFGRFVALDPEATRLALGPSLPPSPEAAGVVLTTYRTFPDATPAVRAKQVLETINARRTAQGLKPHKLSAPLNPLIQSAVDEVSALRANPDDALAEALDGASRSLRSSVQGVWMQTSELDDLPLDKNLRDGPARTLAIGVGVHAPIEEPWARWIIFVVTPSDRRTTFRPDLSPVLARR